MKYNTRQHTKPKQINTRTLQILKCFGRVKSSSCTAALFVLIIKKQIIWDVRHDDIITGVKLIVVTAVTMILTW